MTNDKGHISVDEININKESLEAKIGKALREYMEQTGLTPDIVINNKRMQIASGEYVLVGTEILITQSI